MPTSSGGVPATNSWKSAAVWKKDFGGTGSGLWPGIEVQASVTEAR